MWVRFETSCAGSRWAELIVSSDDPSTIHIEQRIFIEDAKVSFDCQCECECGWGDSCLMWTWYERIPFAEVRRLEDEALDREAAAHREWCRWRQLRHQWYGEGSPKDG